MASKSPRISRGSTGAFAVTIATPLATGAGLCNAVLKANRIGVSVPIHGWVPVSSSNSSRPSAYTSVAVVTGAPVSCSGAAQIGVNGAPAA